MVSWLAMVLAFLAGAGLRAAVREVPEWCRELRMSFLFWRAMRRDD